MSKRAFDLDSFLSNYKPKKLSDALKYYLRSKKLTGYKLLEDNNLSDLVENKIYIRYVKMADYKPNEIDIDANIHAGGFLIGTGYISSGAFIRSSDLNKITHLQLNYIIYDNNGYVMKKNIFNIKLSKYYVFYKIIGGEARDMIVDIIKQI